MQTDVEFALADIKSMNKTIETLKTEVVGLKNNLFNQGLSKQEEELNTCVSRTIAKLLLKGIRGGNDPEEGQDLP